MSVQFRHANDDLADEASVATGLACPEDDDKAVQSAKDDADINVIVRRFGVTGSMAVPNLQPFYGDFSEVEDYHTALNRVLEADAAFMQLDAQVRKRFDNDPGKLMEFLDDPNNYDEAEKLGLLKPKPIDPAPMKVEVVNKEPAVPPVPPAPAGPST